MQNTIIYEVINSTKDKVLWDFKDYGCCWFPIPGSPLLAILIYPSQAQSDSSILYQMLKSI